ncbi:MAG: hypothetical protein GY896_00190 [Gammaproteobacteria bacterium]|nr:hypothetical protein [Gammaproteobacteria bacterium]
MSESTLDTKKVTRAALLGRDYRGVKFELLCREGDEVGAGDAVMRDLRRPAIKFVAPVSGRIARIDRGARRKLISMQIDIDDSVPVAGVEPPADNKTDTLRSFMLESGAWSALRTRPFGNIPGPDGEPAAIFVTALDNDSYAPRACQIIDSRMDEFRASLEVLADISTAPLYLCHAPDHSLAFADSSKIRCVPFSGGYTAGLPGFHINRLAPIGFAGREVWHMGYQDVIALGHLLVHGKPWLHRVISLAGSAVQNPRNLCVVPGAANDELLEGELADGPNQILAGSPLYGRPLDTGQSFLGAGQRQLSALLGKSEESGKSDGVGTIIPSDRLEAASPPGIYPVPLMRALQLGDAERARELGALELVEEDLSPLSLACVSNSDYGSLLRAVLEQIEAAR